MNRRDYFFRQLVTEAELDTGFELAENADRDFTGDVGLAQKGTALHTPFVSVQAGDFDALLGGIHTGFRIGFSPPASGGNPKPLINVPVTAGVAHDAAGQRITLPTAVVLDVTAAGLTPIGEGGSTTGGGAVTPAPGNTRIITIMVLADRQLLDPRVDGNALTVYFERNESFRFQVKAGAPSAGTPLAPPPDPNTVILGDFTVNSSGQIVGESYKRRGDWIRTTSGASGDVSLTDAYESEPAGPTNIFIEGDPRHAILRTLREIAVTGADLTAHRNAGAVPVGLGHRVEGIELLAIVPPYTAPHSFELAASNLQVALQKITNELNAVRTFITVGDGDSSFGEFNVDDYGGVARDCLQAAVDTIPASSTGTIFIKRGAFPYDIVNTTVLITADRRVKIIGEAPPAGFDQVHLRAQGTAPIFTTVGTNSVLELENLTLEITASATASVSVESAVFARHCRIERLTSTAPVASTGAFEDCTFFAGTGTSFNGPWRSTRWTSCRFEGSGNAPILNFTNPVVAALGELRFDNCTMQDFPGSTAVALMDVAESYFNVTIDGFAITGTGAGVGLRFKYSTTGSEQLNLRNVRLSAVAVGAEFQAGARHVNLDSWRIDLTAGVGVLFSAGTGSTRDVTMHDMYLKGGASPYVGMQIFGGVSRVSLTDTTFEDVRSPIQTDSMRDSAITNCRAIQASAGFCNSFLKFVDNTNCARLTLSDCEFDGYSFDGDIRVIDAETAAGTRTVDGLSIRACRFRNIGSGTGANTNTKCVAIAPGTSGVLRAIEVSDCSFASINGVSVVRPIDISGAERVSTPHNTFSLIGTVLGSATSVLNLIRLSDCSRFAVDHNTALVFGNTSAATFTAAISIQASALQEGGTVDHNVLEDLKGAFARGIQVSAGLRRLSIAGNSIRAKTDSAKGIYIQSFASPANAMMTLTGNIIAEVREGIHLSMKETSNDAYAGGRYAFTGNVIDDFAPDGTGIKIESDGGFSHSNNFAVTGNVLHSAQANVIGIDVAHIKEFAIHGNSITLTGNSTTTTRGVRVITSEQGSISGNVIRVLDNNAATKGVDVDNATLFLGVHANTVVMPNSTGTGIAIGSGTVSGKESQTAHNNNVRVAAGGTTISSPNVRQRRGNSDSSADPLLAPTGTGDVSTNWQFAV